MWHLRVARALSLLCWAIGLTLEHRDAGLFLVAACVVTGVIEIAREIQEEVARQIWARVLADVRHAEESPR